MLSSLGMSVNSNCSYKPSTGTNVDGESVLLNPSTVNFPLLKLPAAAKFSHASRRFRNPTAAASGVIAAETPLESEKLGVVVKPMEKPRLVLKFIWMEKNIGLALDQVIPGYGTIPVSPYYFWPRKDAWEELKMMLESKPWISQKQVIILLNQATDIINLWQQSGGDLQ
ncbi:30S ribosomal protein 3, chloroplastic-like [Cynara cardunculus var. scolymus]|uniref:Ribosomal protein PSRP-3/Ycf65 n=1 Tax=Cynara cardunculus var. scolymus TaxID=59895 RepID=A0A103Y5B2_CYNCS|nr:30S ribosomal protein 3, chloroplastic-like [Cynara cardunculus var. scolymus]KVI02804.1 Ribosomal protein PSRP-3/Ycf65 [Cynara cardunculus var. scolymus]